MRTVAVLGPIPRDRIITHRGEVFEKYGCALYTVAALSALMEPTDRICPIVHVRKQDEAAIKDLLAPDAERRPHRHPFGHRPRRRRPADLRGPEHAGASARPAS